MVLLEVYDAAGLLNRAQKLQAYRIEGTLGCDFVLPNTVREAAEEAPVDPLGAAQYRRSPREDDFLVRPAAKPPRTLEQALQCYPCARKKASQRWPQRRNEAWGRLHRHNGPARDVLDHLHRLVAAVSFWAQPDHHLQRLAVYRAHQGDLVRFLLLVVLVDADYVRPDNDLLRLVAHGAQSRRQ
jgi:hypothetical protein